MSGKKFQDAQDLAKLVGSNARSRLLAGLLKHDEALSASYGKVAEEIRKGLKATGYTVKQVQAVLEKAMESSQPERLAIMEGALKSAVKEARGLDKSTFDAIFGGSEEAAKSGPFPRSSKRTLKPLARRLPPSGRG